jgi:small subunit ribosomal protein S6e
MRRRKTIRGNEIAPELVQVNAIVTGYGLKPIDEIVPKTEGAGKKKKAEKKTKAASPRK